MAIESDDVTRRRYARLTLEGREVVSPGGGIRQVQAWSIVILSLRVRIPEAKGTTYRVHNFIGYFPLIKIEDSRLATHPASKSTFDLVGDLQIEHGG
jgi:hypothetical protein